MLRKENDYKILVIIIVYYVIIIMPFIVINVFSYRDVISKLFFLYIVSIISIITLIRLRVTEFKLEHKIALVPILSMLTASIL